MKLIEIERKRTITPPQSNKLIACLKKLGYKQIENFKEVDTYYSRRDIDYMKTVECLRVREKNGQAEITYKPETGTHNTTTDGIIAKRELDVMLADDKQAVLANDLLETIGLVKLVTVDKRRQTFSKDNNKNTTIVIDMIEGAGVFVEVEVMSSDVDLAKKTLLALETSLHIDSCKIVTIPYRDIVMANIAEKI